MAPCIADKSILESREKTVNVLQLANLKKAIPKEAFEKSLLKSVYYMFFDYAMWFGSVYAMYTLCNSSMWSTMPLWQKAVASVVFWNFAGFFMWCMFVVGHDCGHTNFSNYQLLNDIIGHITHGSLLVPYYPWQVSRCAHCSIDDANLTPSYATDHSQPPPHVPQPRVEGLLTPLVHP